MFPYPSGAGLHVGHPLGYIGTDSFGRFQRMRGRNVLHTMGFDAFGLPAEQYAIQTGTHPRTTTEANIEEFRRQLRRLGLGYDERRSVATSDVAFYRWTQWIFLQLFNSWYDPEANRARPIESLVAAFAEGTKVPGDGRRWADLSDIDRRRIIDDHRLAYVAEAPVNWCPGLGTVLADAEVTADGRSERGNFPVFHRTMRQWLMRITAYADRLADDLDELDWPEPIKLMQRNWIGRSTGAYIDFPTDAGALRVFTTRPDTVFGATYMVVAPEHDLVDGLVPDAWPAGTPAAWTNGHPDPATAVAAYREYASGKTDVERAADAKAKTGVFTGAFATNPATGARIPIFIADYVLVGYGTGAIMAVPGQDERDWAFAGAYGLPIVRTVAPPDGFEGDAYLGEGPAINSSNPNVGLDLNGLTVADGEGAHHRMVGTQRLWLGRHHVSVAGLAVQPATVLGRAVPDRLRRDRPAGGAAGVDAAGRVARRRRLRAEDVRGRRRDLGTGDAAVPRDRLGERRAGPGRRSWLAAVPPRDERDAAVGRLVLVRAALPGSGQRQGIRRRRRRALLDGPAIDRRHRRRRPVRRRCRARRAAPALRPLLAQGAVRPGARVVPGTVPAAVQPGLHPGLRVRRSARRLGAGRGRGRTRRALPVRRRRGHPALRQDGQVAAQRGHAGRDVRPLRRRHVPRLRDVDGSAGRVAAVGDARCRRSVPFPATGVAHRGR